MESFRVSLTLPVPILSVWRLSRVVGSTAAQGNISGLIDEAMYSILWHLDTRKQIWNAAELMELFADKQQGEKRTGIVYLPESQRGLHTM